MAALKRYVNAFRLVLVISDAVNVPVLTVYAVASSHYEQSRPLIQQFFLSDSRLASPQSPTRSSIISWFHNEAMEPVVETTD
jgi:hypothetical protein